MRSNSLVGSVGNKAEARPRSISRATIELHERLPLGQSWVSGLSFLCTNTTQPINDHTRHMKAPLR